MELLEWS